MAFNNVTINKGQGGLGRALPGTDYISGILFYSDQTAPTGFTTANSRIVTVYSVEDAEDYGITNAHLNATAATGSYEVTTKFAANDTFKITCATIDSTNPIEDIATAGTVTLCDFTAVTADAVSITTSGDRIALEINNGTPTHGFSAVNTTGTVVITAPKNQGIFLNSGTPYVVTKTGSVAGTLTQSVTPGVASHVDILHYHISEFFRLQPKGKLYVSFQATADVGTFSKATTLQDVAGGEIKQLAVYYISTAFTSAHCTTLQSINTALEALHKPYWSILLAGEISGTANVTSLTTNLRLLTAPTVSVVIGQDGANDGFTLFKATGKSITNVGETLGAVALANVNESIAWLAKYQVSATELDWAAYANGQLFKDVSNGASVNLDSYGYMFLRKVIGLGGTYHNRPYTCVSSTSDYSFIQNNRTIYKAIQNTRAILLPETGRPILVNSDGTLTEDVIGYFQGLCKQALDVMVRDSEISNYAAIIDPAQNVLSTNELVITIQIQPVGVADFITVNIGFTDVITTTV
jgi:hypothetical protein